MIANGIADLAAGTLDGPSVGASPSPEFRQIPVHDADGGIVESPSVTAFCTVCCRYWQPAERPRADLSACPHHLVDGQLMMSWVTKHTAAGLHQLVDRIAAAPPETWASVSETWHAEMDVIAGEAKRRFGERLGWRAYSLVIEQAIDLVHQRYGLDEDMEATDG